MGARDAAPLAEPEVPVWTLGGATRGNLDMEPQSFVVVEDLESEQCTSSP